MSYSCQALQSAIRQEQALAFLRRVCGDDRRARELHQRLKERAAKAALETVESFDSAFQRELDACFRELGNSL